MEKEIYDIIMKKTNNNEILDEKDLKRLLDILIKMFSFKRDIRLEIISDLNTKSLGHTRKKEDVIRLNIDNTLDKGLIEDIYFHNYNIFKSLVHEFTHKMQFEYIGTNLNDFTDPIQRLDNFLNIVSHNIYSYKHLDRVYGDDKDRGVKVRNLYNTNHDLVPQERLAELNALNVTKNIISKFDNDSRKGDLLDFYDRNICYHTLYGYKLSDDKKRIEYSPLINYLKTFIMDEYIPVVDQLINELKQADLLTEELSLYYGLPVNKKTYNECVYKYNELNKKLSKKYKI